MTKIIELEAEKENLLQYISELEDRLAQYDSEQKSSKQISTENNDQFSVLFETMALGVVYQDADGAITHVNPAAERILGLTKEEIQGGKSVDPRWHAIHEDGSEFPDAQHPAKLAMQTGKPVIDTVMGVYHFQNKEYRWILINAIPEFRANETDPYQVYATFIDITERKQAEEILIKSETRVSGFLNAAPDAMVIINGEGKITLANKQVERIFGYTQDDLLGIDIEHLVPASNRTKHKVHRTKFFEDPYDREMGTGLELSGVRKDGSEFPAEISISHFKNGDEVMVLSTIRDITERKRANEKLRQSEEQYRYLFENNPHPMWAYDLKTLDFLAVNDAAIEQYGYSRKEFLEMTIADIRPPDDLARLYEDLKLTRPPLLRSGEWRHRLKNGTIIDVTISSHTLNIFDRDAALVVAQDITKRKQAERELLETAGDLTLINRLNEAVNRGESIDGLVKLLQEECQNLFSARDASLYLLSPDEKTLNMPGFSLPQEIIEKLEKIIGRQIPPTRLKVKPGGMFHKLLYANEGTITTDPQEIQQWMAEFAETEAIPASLKVLIPKFIPQIYRLLEVQSIVSMPLNLAGKTIGLLGISSKNLLGRNELDRLQKISGHLTAAILRKRDEEALRISKERFEQLANNIHEVFWMFDRGQDQIIYISPAYETIWGRTCESLLQNSRDYMESILPEDQLIKRSRLEKQNRGEPTETEFRIRRPDGSIRWIWDRSFPIFDKTGKLIRTTGVATDITERKLAENEAEYRQKLLEKVIQLGKNITTITDPQLCLKEIHRSVTQGLGFDRIGLFLFDAAKNIVRGGFGTSRSGQMEDNSWYVMPIKDWEEWQIALKSPAGVALTDDYQTTYNPPADHEMFGVNQHLTLAIWAGDKPVALITVDNLISQRTISRADIEALQLFAGYAGLAIENANLHAGLEQRVKERTAEVQDLYDHAPTGYHSLDGNGTYILVNQTELAWLGYSMEELIGKKTIYELSTPQGQRVFSENFPKLKQQGRVKDLELEMVRKDGTIFPVLLNATALYDESGNFMMSRSTIFDITERKKAELALCESEERYRKAISAANAVPYSLDYATNTYTFIGEEIERITGYTRDEITPHLFDSFIRGTSMQGDLGNLPTHEATRLVRSGQVPQNSVLRSDFQIQNKDEEIRWLSDISLQIWDDHGFVTGSIGILQDITERKLVEESLRESEEQNRLLFEESPDAITLLDTSGKIIRANHAYEQLTKISLDKMLGMTAESLGLITSETFEILRTSLEKAISRNEFFIAAEYLLSCADGKVRNAESRIFLLKLGGVDHILVTTRDISTHKQAEETLRRANKEMEQAMRMKDEFLASMSHELRTPLTSVLGLSEAMQLKTYGELTEKQLRSLKNIEDSGRHLLDLINDILDLSKIEAGKLDLNFEICSLADICQASLQLTNGMAHQKHQIVQFSVNQASMLIRADSRRLKQMLVNLLGNAIKFTPDGGELGLDVKLVETEHVVEINVWDRGPGIRADDLPRLFKPFQQLDSGLSRQHSGTGLGLSLVQKMADLHGGSVQVESTPGEGSRFTIVLPWSSEATQPIQVIYRTTASLRLALLIEDNSFDIEQITRYMKNIGVSTVVHKTALGAFEKAELLRPSIILLDLNLNNQSGLDVLTKLKANEVTKDIPVVIVSVEESRTLAISLGAVGYLVKPFNEKDLRAELDRIKAYLSTSNNVTLTTSENNGPSILVVDDNEVILETISDFLRSQKYQVITASSGKELLEIGASALPDLILMDIQMPGMDGLEAIRRIRAHENKKLAKSLIVAVTALSMPGDRERCLKSGADEYLSKPIRMKSLNSLIENLLLKEKHR